jgi:hypothetical protein
MPSLDVFRGDGFSVLQMTAAIEKSPFTPGRIGAMGLFTKKPINTTRVTITRKSGRISLLPSKPRGARPTVHDANKAVERDFSAVHIPYTDTIIADAIQNARAWDSEDELMAVGSVVNERLDSMRQDHEVTHEYHRIGAIKGVILDADGATTLLDIYNAFGIAQTSVDFLLGTPATSIKGMIESVKRSIQDAMGGLSYTGIHCLCGNTFWDKLIAHTTMATAWNLWNNGQFFRESQRDAGGFEFDNVYFENYRGQVGDVPFIGASDAYFFPLGVKDLFLEHYAPGTMMDAVNTPGREVYASQEVLPHNKGVELYTESNPLMICTRPEVVIKGTTSN